MKNRAILLFGKLTLIIILLLNVNCEKDEVNTKNINEGSNTENELKFKDNSFNNLFKNPIFKNAYLKTIELNSNLKQELYENKGQDQNLYDFTIDSSSIKQIEYKKAFTYSFYIKREKRDSTFFENLVIKVDSLNNLSAYLLKFTYNSKPILNSRHNSYSFDGDIDVIKIDYSKINSQTSKSQFECTDMYKLMCNNSNGHCSGSWHIVGPRCNSCIAMKQVDQSCGYFDDETGGPSSGGFDDDNTYTSGGGYGGSNGPNNNNPEQLIIIPNDCKNCPDAFNDEILETTTSKLTSRLSLNFQESNFLNNKKLIAEDILNFLEKNNNVEGEKFAKNALQVLIKGNAKEKEIAKALLNGNEEAAMNLLLEGASYSNNQCPNPPCPEDVAEEIVQDIVITINNTFDGEVNILMMLHDYLILDPYTRTLRTGHVAKHLLKKSGADISEDIHPLTLGNIFKVRVRGRQLVVEPANQDLWDVMNDVGTSIFDVAILVSPIKGGGAFTLLAKTGGGKITASAVSNFLKNYKSIAKTTLKGGKGYNSFYLLKKAVGKLKPGNVLHHIVEQNGFKKLNTLKFGKKNIHNTKNVIQINDVKGGLHKRITGYYNSIDPRYSDTKIIREWLADKNFKFQYEFGIERLKEFGWDGLSGIIK